MTTIRPQGPAAVPPNPARDARAAFFGKAAAPVAAPATPSTAPVAARQASPPAPAVTPLRPLPETMPDRPLRPGSIINIRV